MDSLEIKYKFMPAVQDDDIKHILSWLRQLRIVKEVVYDSLEGQSWRRYNRHMKILFHEPQDMNTSFWLGAEIGRREMNHEVMKQFKK